MKTNLSVAMLILFPFFKAQSTYTYTETNPISRGYICEESILTFTSSIDTIVKGRISASDQIFIIPTQGYGIMILPTDPCVTCTEPDNTPTVGTRKGGGKGNDKHVDVLKPIQQQVVVIEKNPVEDILKLSLKTGEIKTIKIYNTSGQEVLSKDHNTRTSELDVSKLIKGVYWVKTTTTEKQTYTKQFIKK